MSGQPTNPGIDDMDFNETLLKERFEAAVGDIRPDVVSLTGGGVQTGRGMVRRRTQWVGAAAALVLIVAGVAIAGASNSFLGDKPVQPTGPDTVMQLEPATARGLAAAVISQTNELGELYAAGGTKTELSSTSGEFGLMATVAYTLPDGRKVEFQAYASPDVAGWGDSGCTDLGQGGTCRDLTLPDGTPAVYIEFDAGDEFGSTTSGEEIAAANGLAVKRPDQIVYVVQTVVGSKVFPLDGAALETILEDPAIGLSTTADFNAKGMNIADFGTGISAGSGEESGSGSSTSSVEPASPPQSSDVEESGTGGPGRTETSSADSGSGGSH